MVKITALPQRQQRVRNGIRVQVSSVNATARTLRNRRRRQRQRMNRAMASEGLEISTNNVRSNPLMVLSNDTPYSSSATQGVKTQFVAPPSRSLGMSGIGMDDVKRSIAARVAAQMKCISPDGMKFLKCAFAPPDFAYSDVKGVPDDYMGTSLVKKSRFNNTITNPSLIDTYILLLPVPGVAYYSLNITAGTPVGATNLFRPTFYSDVASMFPTSSTSTSVVNSFRFVSNHIELVPTVNATQWSGSIQAFKLPLSVIPRIGIGSLGNGLQTITGLEGVNGSNVNMYSGPICNGLYSGCYSSDSSFRFSQVFEDCSSVPFANQPSDFSAITSGTMPNGVNMGVPGFDNGMECLCIKISNSSPTLQNQFFIRTYACVEYKVTPGAALAEYQTVSANKDEIALRLYREIIKELPVGVHYLDNDTFWQRVLEIIARLGGTMSMLPGPYGAIAGGVGSIAAGIRNLTL